MKIVQQATATEPGSALGPERGDRPALQRSASAPLAGDNSSIGTARGQLENMQYSLDALQCAAERPALRRAAAGSRMYQHIFSLPRELRTAIFQLVSVDQRAFATARAAIAIDGDVRATRMAVRNAAHAIPAGLEEYGFRKIGQSVRAVRSSFARASGAGTLVDLAAAHNLPAVTNFAKNFAVDLSATLHSDELRQIALTPVLEHLQLSPHIGLRESLADMCHMRNDDRLFGEILLASEDMQHSLVRSEILQRLVTIVRTAEILPGRKTALYERLLQSVDGIRQRLYRQSVQNKIAHYIADNSYMANNRVHN